MPTGFFQSIIRSTVAPVRSANSGSGIGESLSILGRTVGQIADLNSETEQKVAAVDHEISMRERERDDDALALSVAVEQTKATQRLRIFDEENRTNADYEKLYAAQVDKEVGQLRGMIGVNDRVAKRYEVPLTQMAESEKADAIVYATKMRVKATSAGYTEMAETLANVAMSDPKKAMPGIAMLRETIRTSTVIDDALKPMIEREMVAPIIVAGMNAAIDRGEYADVEAAMNAGTFDAEISDDAKKGLLRNIELARKAEAVALAQAEVDARKSAKEALEVLEAQFEAGESPSAAAVNTAVTAAKAAGVPDADLIRYRTNFDDAKILRAYNGANDATGEKSAAAVAAMDARFAAGKATPADVRMRDKLDGYADSRAKKMGTELKEIAKQGVAGQQQALAQLQALPMSQRFAAAEEAMPGLGQIALYPAHTQQYILQGREIRKDTARKGEYGKDEEVLAAYRKRIQGGVASDLGGEYGNLMDIAAQIYTGAMASRGKSGWDEGAYDKAVQIAFGATQRKDGTLQGGVRRVRNNQVILPGWTTATEFDSWLSRMDYSNARYKGGFKASKADILAHYRPKHVGDAPDDSAAYYHFIDADGLPLLNDKGRPFQADAKR